MNKEPIFDYNKETGEASCIILDGQNTFYGTAKCHPDDQDHKSEYTGCEIAYRRAQIKVLQHIKNNDIIPTIRAYEHLISTMLKSKHLNPKSYEFQRIKSEYDNAIHEYERIKFKIKEAQIGLRTYIQEKNNMSALMRVRAFKGNLNDLGIVLNNPDGTPRNAQDILSDLSDKWKELGNNK